MVFLLESSSLHDALESLSKKTQKRLASRVFTNHALSCYPNAVNKRKTVQFSLRNCFKSKRDLPAWHDVFNNSSSKHPSNEIISKPRSNYKTSRDEIKAILYQRDKVCLIYLNPLKNTVSTVHNLKELNSERKALKTKLFK